MMKWISLILNISAIRRTFRSVANFMKLAMMCSFCIILLFVFISLGSYLQSYWLSDSPVSSMKGLAASVSGSFFIDIIGMELPFLDKDEHPYTFSKENMMIFAFRMLTNMNPRDPKSVLASELPGINLAQTTVLRSSKAPNPSEPMDLEPSSGAIMTRNSLESRDPTQLSPSPTPIFTPNPRRHLTRDVAFVYQTHSNESFLPELSGVTQPDRAYDDKVNITLVGKRLVEQLEQAGVGAVHSDRIYPGQVENFKYPLSYTYSLKTLHEAVVSYPQLNYFFDIHRDSSARNRTTFHMNGEDYAQVYFIIGGKNAQWKQNEEFANQIHQILEQHHPGISKGIHAKTEKESNGVFNQHFSSNSVLVEIGGPYNSLAECYRTVDLLASAISEVILQVKKVDVTG